MVRVRFTVDVVTIIRVDGLCCSHGHGHSDNAMVIVRIILMVMVRLTDRLPI